MVEFALRYAVATIAGAVLFVLTYYLYTWISDLVAEWWYWRKYG